ncbi:MAG: hypothetical protein HC927_10535 [Deltaproteobacteria bacterium]|nr:hypothetical protein [Deltaproteobacteria bacterium]
MLVARDLYNFIWVLPDPPPPTIGPIPHRTETTVATRTVSTRGVIVFPALLTPLVHVQERDGEWLELIIASELELTADMVDRQLKISAGLRGEKPYDPAPLFGGAAGNIEVESIGQASDDRETIISTHSRFAGILHPSFATALADQRVRRLYRVKVRVSAIPTSSPQDERIYSSMTSKFTGYRLDGTTPRRVTRAAVVGRELSDVMIRSMLNRRFGADASSNLNTIPGRAAMPSRSAGRASTWPRSIPSSRSSPITR